MGLQKAYVRAVKIMPVEGLVDTERQGDLNSQILKLLKKIKAGRMAKIDPKGINPGHFAAQVSKIRTAGKLPKGVHVLRRSPSEFFLVRN